MLLSTFNRVKCERTRFNHLQMSTYNREDSLLGQCHPRSLVHLVQTKEKMIFKKDYALLPCGSGLVHVQHFNASHAYI